MFMDAPAANAPDFDPKLTGDRLEATLDGTVSRVTREYIKLAAGRRTGASMAHCSPPLRRRASSVWPTESAAETAI